MGEEGKYVQLLDQFIDVMSSGGDGVIDLLVTDLQGYTEIFPLVDFVAWFNVVGSEW
jgi:hypothetical protein